LVDAIAGGIKLYINGGLAMRRTHDITEEEQFTESSVVNFHSDLDEGGLDYIYMRATANNDNNNNVVITNDGTMMIGASDVHSDLVTMKTTVDNDPNNIKLYVNGSIAVSDGNATNLIVSDQRFKKNIVPLENSLDVIRKSNFVEYQYNDLAGVASNKKYYGILAQEMQKVLPSTVKKGRKMMRPDAKSATEFLMFNPNDLIYSGLNAIKELDKENQDLKDRVAELEIEAEKNKTLEQRVNQLEKMLAQLADGKEIGEQTDVTRTINDATSSYLYQNQPNPSRNFTNIEYYLPGNLSNAKIVVQDMNGNKIAEFNVQGAGMGKVAFNAGQFGITSGTYIYSLIADETVIASKKMILIE